MSLVTRTLKLLVVSGGASLSPQSVPYLSQWFQKTFKTTIAPPEPVSSQETQQASHTTSQESNASTTQVSPSIPAVPPPPPIEEVLKKDGYEGCALLAGQKAPRWLYVCWKEDRTSKPSFFHYDRTKRGLKPEEKIKQIISITYSSSAKSATMQIKNGTTEPLKPLPFWVNKLKDKELKPDSDCSLTHNGGKSSYKLSCQVEQEIFSQNIQM